MQSAEVSTEATDLESIVATLTEARSDALRKIEEADNPRDLQAVKVEFLGKKGRVTSFLKMLGKMKNDDRPKLGSSVNAVRDELEVLFAERKETLEDEELNAKLESESVDVTMPGIINHPPGTLHPITATIEKAVEIFERLGYEVVDGPEMSPEIETDYYCFEALNCPEDHPARDMQDTFYLDDDKKVLLRTHTSSVQIRYMEQNEPPFAIIAPGRVYRRDTVDSTHSALFHQVEIMALGKDLDLGHLRGTIIHFLKEMFGDDVEVRFRGSFFPFTEPSMEVDVFFRGKWLEVLGCGMVDPAVLEKAGLDPDEWQGFAAGFGIERFAMVIHEIPDIREFYKNDMRFLSQFTEPRLGF